MPVGKDGQWVMPDKAMPKGVVIPQPIPGMRKATWRVGDLKKALPDSVSQIAQVRGIAMDIEESSAHATTTAEECLKSLKAALDQFKATIGNDLASIKAAAARVQSETNRMKEGYLAAQHILSTPEFERAIANAERMATALSAISELAETKISVAVFSGGKATSPEMEGR